MDEILTEGVKRKASDVHFTAGIPPQVRVDGEWRPYADTVLSAADCAVVALKLLGEKRMTEFLVKKECDVSYSIPGVGRFRVNVFLQRSSIGAAVRILPYTVLDFEGLGLPGKVVRELCEMPNGMVLICGPTGSGKSTTLAAMIQHINTNRREHIVTIEDPIEFLHQHNKSIVDQREVGADTDSFADAMRHVLRQSPDVVLVGEIRDPESVHTALMIAETGHLVFSTIHSGEAAQGLSRLVDMFPSDQEREIRVSLSLVLRAMIVQQLLPGLKERRRVLACEVMLVDAAIRSLIREGKFEHVYSQIQTRHDVGMRTMNSSLMSLWRAGEISGDLALAKSANVKELKALMEHSQGGQV